VPAQLVVPVTERDHFVGPASAPVTLVEYADFQCGHCARAHPLIQGVRRYMGDALRFVFRHFPLAEAHPHAQHAAEAAEAAAAQGHFWEMHDSLFTSPNALDDENLLICLAQVGVDVKRASSELSDGAHTRKVRDDFRGGVRSGVNGTPTFFINGYRYDDNWADSPAFIEALSAAASQVHAGIH
jgi:protein-disulfide isomerase